ncbi:predicted protein [Histoplasma capsulatum G186AR]|uniref:Uncharacterized protein n=1 Tax=Ajellomyces capsulatus (strain G186AR / H82 / ATCC MYA-2454 / RMSCC 2432) TaxID=447093 RepID=C0NLM9_AJECG|nr:uncharacterized protein HCBG_04409 [Histoplasma capsulatum G186AR]EEH07530.1 predicted protein [Histoplasma capsulatum G186AR]
MQATIRRHEKKAEETPKGRKEGETEITHVDGSDNSLLPLPLAVNHSWWKNQAMNGINSVPWRDSEEKFRRSGANDHDEPLSPMTSVWPNPLFRLSEVTTSGHSKAFSPFG